MATPYSPIPPDVMRTRTFSDEPHDEAHCTLHQGAPPATWKQAITKRIYKAPAKMVAWFPDMYRQAHKWVRSRDFLVLVVLITLAMIFALLRGHHYADFEEYVLSFKGNWRSRLYVMCLVVVMFGVQHVWMLLIVDCIMLFGPKGDMLTVGGRHKFGDPTWFMVKRGHAISFHLIHYVIVILVAQLMRNRGPVQIPQVSGFMNSLAQKTGMRGLRVNSERVLPSTISLVNIVVFVYFFFAALSEAQLPIPHCISEKNRDLAVILHQFYLWSCGLQLLWSVVMMMGKATPTWRSCFESYPVTYWFWGLVLYYCPADDVWLPMCMECVRTICTSYCRMFNKDMPMVGPMTAAIEVLHFLASASGLCPFPKVLWLRLPRLAAAIRGLLNDIVRRLSWGRTWTTLPQLARILAKGLLRTVDDDEVEEVTVFTLVTHPCLQGSTPTKCMRPVPGFEEARKTGVEVEPLVMQRGISGRTELPGRWCAFPAQCVFGDHMVTVEKEGQFKVLHPLRDFSGALGRAVFGKGSERYLAKRYHKDPQNGHPLEEEVQKNRCVNYYFYDVLMQELTAYYANKYSELDVPCKVEMVKACVIERNSVLVVGGGSEQNNSFDVSWESVRGKVTGSAVMTPMRYRSRQAFAQEVQRALNSITVKDEPCPIKFTVTVEETTNPEQDGPFAHRLHIQGDRTFDLVFLDGPSGDAAERAAELMGFDPYDDVQGQRAYRSGIPPRGFYLLERCMDGCYTKYNNNSFWPSKLDMSAGRNTPNAFTHFTYKHTHRKLLVCDIQGVGDFYTDPQIHTDDHDLRKFVYNTPGFWDGRTGSGLLAVLLSHQPTCGQNEICRDLHLKDYWWKGELSQDTMDEIAAINERNHLQAHAEAEKRRKHGHVPENTGLGFRGVDLYGGAGDH